MRHDDDTIEWLSRRVEMLNHDLHNMTVNRDRLEAEVDLLREAIDKSNVALAEAVEWKGRAERAELQVRDLHEWARSQARAHHKLAVEDRDNDAMSDQHNSLSSAYYRLADEIQKRMKGNENTSTLTIEHHENCDTLDPMIKGKPCNCKGYPKD